MLNMRPFQRKLKSATNSLLQNAASGQLNAEACWDLDLSAGLRVATGASCTLYALYREQTGNLYSLTLLQGLNQHFLQCVQRCVCVGLGQASLGCNCCNQIGTVQRHVVPFNGSACSAGRLL